MYPEYVSWATQVRNITYSFSRPMSTLEVNAEDIRPEHNIALPPQANEIVIVGVQTLEELGSLLNTNNLSPDDWERIFSRLKDTVEQVQVQVGDEALIGRVLSYGKEAGKSVTPQMVLSPNCGIEIDEDWGDVFLTGSYYHACGASGERHFHAQTFRIDEELSISPEQASAMFRWLFERAVPENLTADNISRQDDQIVWTGSSSSGLSIPAGSIMA